MRVYKRLMLENDIAAQSVGSADVQEMSQYNVNFESELDTT